MLRVIIICVFIWCICVRSLRLILCSLSILLLRWVLVIGLLVLCDGWCVVVYVVVMLCIGGVVLV